VVLIPLLVSAYSTAQAQPARGDWKAPTAFGELGFTVHPDGTKITKIIFDVRNWSCGPVSGSWKLTQYWTDSTKGWPITNNQFSWIKSGTSGPYTEVYTVNGTFTSAGNNAFGTWGYSIGGTICSGNWGPVGPATFVEDESILPKHFALEQNFPNPFNPSTTITFGLPRASQVTLSVFDMLGREVSVLVNDRRDAGVHEVEFNGATLPSGVYFYRLQAGDFVHLKKLVLLK
jgi:hypothetical protein